MGSKKKKVGKPDLTPELIEGMMRCCHVDAGETPTCKDCPAYGYIDSTGRALSCISILDFGDHIDCIPYQENTRGEDLDDAIKALIVKLIDPLYVDLLKVKELSDG